MKDHLDDLVSTDLQRKVILLTGPRQMGNTPLCRQQMAGSANAQYFSWDIAVERAILQRGSWNPRSNLLVMDEIHKMPDWKNWLKGVVDGRPPTQALPVTGSARMETWRQSGDSPAGRYLAFRLHPISVREWCEHQGASPAVALTRLMERGGFPEPCLAANLVDADRWRKQYFTNQVHCNLSITLTD